MSDAVYWPEELGALWEQIFACTDCQKDPKLAEQITWAQYVPLKTIGLLPPPRRTCTYLVLGAEPSGAGRVISRAESLAKQRGVTGGRNFNGTRADMSLQFAIERWLLDEGKGESYYITDLAKCRVAGGGVASRTGERRYANCVPWLERELAILKPRAIILAGKSAYRGAKEQRRSHWPPMFEISHWGFAGVAYWKRYLDPGWEKFVPETAELSAFARKRWPLSFHKKSADEKLGKIPESYRWLLMTYRTQMLAIRKMLEGGSSAASTGRSIEIPESGGMRAIFPEH